MRTRRPTTVLAGRYALKEELGRSHTGIAWRAEDELLGRVVTVKLVHPRLGDDPAFSNRLMDEARRVASLSAPGIARLLDSGDEEGLPFLVREHVDGVSARARLETSGPMSAEAAIRIGIAALEALAPAHEAGILHLRLALDDVLLVPDGGVRLTDFAIGPAVTATRSPDEAARLLGGDGLAPEQSETGAVDLRTDVFAVGAILFELLTGEPPRGRSSPRECRPALPRALDRTISRALAPSPDKRFEDVRSFASALRANVTADDGGEVRAGLGSWLAMPVAIVLAAIAAIGAGLWLGRLEVGGPLGIRPAEEPTRSSPPDAATQTIAPLSVDVADPFGTRGENDSNAPLAIDGDATTAWRSENYFDGVLNKEGVGLVFDLGERRDVAGFRLTTPSPGFIFHVAVGDEPDALVEAVGPPFTAEPETTGELEGSGRYVLVWITTVVEVADGHRAEISEFEVVVGADA